MIRFFDFFFAFMGLLFLFPLLILVWIIGWFDNYSPLFWQKRVGRNQKTFFLIKFRTMKFNTASIATHLIDDNVITPFGHFLRRTKIDEIPQLITVLKGDMSLIGPRPERPEIDLDLSKEIINYNLKFLAKPGLSGWAQVNYPYGASISDSKIKLSYDIYYLKNFSLFLDLLIFFKTMKLVFNSEGSVPNDQ